MGKFQIFPDGRAAGSAPVSGSDFVNLDTLNSSSVWVKSTGSPSAVLSAKAGNDNQVTASGQYAVAFGVGNKVNGIELIASGVASFAHGYGTNADGRYSHAEGHQSRASNIAAHAEGHSSAGGYASHAEGISTTAVASGSHAEGYNTVASRSFSHAEGKQTIAFAEAAHAEGLETTASANYSHAEGRNTLVSAEGAHAEGYFTEASGTYSHAEGLNTKTTNQGEHAQGKYNATASNQIFSIGVGDTEARRKNAVSVRTGGTVYIYGVGGYLGSGSVSGAESVQSVISSLTGSIASASYSSTDKKIHFFNAGGTASAEIDATDFIKDGMVDSVEVSGSYLVLTFNTDAGKEPVSMSLTRIFDPDNFYTKTDVDTLLSTMSVGDVNVIEAVEFNGTASTISGKTASINVELPAAPNQDAENWVTENSASLVTESVWVRGTGSGSAILSGSTGAIASGVGAVAHGRSFSYDGDSYTLEASGDHSHAEGSGSRATGPASHAEGRASQASGPYSHAEGSWLTRAVGTGSHAEGYGAEARGNYSHAEGNGTSAVGNAAHAEGGTTRATALYSHAEGWGTKALGTASHAEGNYTVASNTAEHACGKYNLTASNQIFSVGVGRSGAGAQRNAISVITGSGNPLFAYTYIYGVGTYNGQNPQPGTNDLATVINNLTASGGGGITTETDPVYLADSASLKNAATWVGSNSASIIASGALAKTAIQPAATASWDTAASQSHTHSNGSLLNSLTNAKTGSWDGTATWVTANSSSALAVSPASVTASINAAIGGITASHHTHSNKAVLDGITAAKTASWDSAATSAAALNSISASLIASGTLAKNVTAITASLVASASVAKTASSSAAALSAKSASWDALVGLPAVTAADNGKILRVVNGAWALVDPVTVYSGQGAPDSALGQDGDIYLQS